MSLYLITVVMTNLLEGDWKFLLIMYFFILFGRLSHFETIPASDISGEYVYSNDEEVAKGEEDNTESGDDNNDDDMNGNDLYEDKGANQIDMKGKDSCSEEEDDDFYNTSAEDVAAQKQRFAELNENALEINVTKGVYDGSRYFYVVGFGDTIWYNSSKQMKVHLEMLHEKKGVTVPSSIQHLSEHKLRVEYSDSNQMEIPTGKKYPKSRWMTVIAASPVNPEDDLNRELKKLSKHFKKLLGSNLVPSPGMRWMDYTQSSGNTRVIEVCKSYMGDDDNVVIDRVNKELIDMGNKPHRYTYEETMDKFLPDYYIKRFLQDFLNATSWDSVNEKVKKICYKGYPNRKLPDWDKITV